MGKFNRSANPSVARSLPLSRLNRTGPERMVGESGYTLENPAGSAAMPYIQPVGYASSEVKLLELQIHYSPQRKPVNPTLRDYRAQLVAHLRRGVICQTGQTT